MPRTSPGSARPRISRPAAPGASRRWAPPLTPGHCCTTPRKQAFRAQIDALGVGTTLLVDTYDTARGVETAIRVAGTGLGGVRIDSGDLPNVAAQVRAQLDELGATGTRITVTSDLDEFTIAALAASPVDSYGVGTSVVTGSGTPTAGMVYKLVARQGSDGGWVAVEKASVDKTSKGGRKAAFRTLEQGTATSELIAVSDGFEELETAVAHPDARALQVPLVVAGEPMPRTSGQMASPPRAAITLACSKSCRCRALALSRSDPAIPTVYVDAG